MARLNSILFTLFAGCMLSCAQELICPGPIMRTIGGSAPAAPAAGYAAWFKAGVGVTNVAGNAAGNGDQIKSWQDSSGNGYHVSGVTLYPTNRTAILNGYSVIEFTNTERGLSFSGTGLNLDRNVNGFTMFAVFSPLVDESAEREVISFKNNGSGGRSVLFLGYPTAHKVGFGGRTADADAGDFTAGSTYTVGAWYIASVVFDNLGAKKYLYLNGSIDASDLAYQDPEATSNTASSGAAIGSFADNTTTLTCNAYIAEVLIYQSALSDTDRQTTENYLNDKFSVY